jgi:hypothetical protein
MYGGEDVNVSLLGCNTVWILGTSVSEEHTASVFKSEVHDGGSFFLGNVVIYVKV